MRQEFGNRRLLDHMRGETLLTRMLIRNEDAASTLSIRVPSGTLATVQEVKLASVIPCAPPAQPDELELARVREAIFEILDTHW